MQSQTSLPPGAAITNESGVVKNAGHAGPASRAYWLPSHVFVCQTQDCVVFLDAHHDRYLGVGGPDAQALRAVLAAHPSREARVDSAAALSSQLTQALDNLLARGLLTLEPTSGRQFRQVDLRPGSRAVGIGAEYEHAPRLTHVLAALIACAGARFDLRFRGIGSTVLRLVKDKQDCRRSDSSAFPDQLGRLVGIFRVIRPFLYAKKDQCLFHGLALYKFLRFYGFNPTWVIGVSTAPFSAHCWVQYGDCVLDDSPEQTLEFTPMAAI